MKQVLLRTVGAIALTICIVSYLVPVKGMASVKTNAHHRSFVFDGDLKNSDTVSVDANFKVITQVSVTTHRFHFIIQQTGVADLASANISSDFAVEKGFVAAQDALNVAKLVIGKIKANVAVSINKTDMDANKIHYAN